MSMSYVHDMYIVPHTGAVTRRIVSTENIQLLIFAESSTGDTREDIKDQSISRVLTDQHRLMCTHRIEIAQYDKFAVRYF